LWNVAIALPLALNLHVKEGQKGLCTFRPDIR